ncbi:MAG: hypothetical protein UT33_C0005G0095 [Candidatus Peregrinibacteria bacterium GW2011_GWC2_39_14]|nr:MAG: hypothetical protein US92_C0001G0095 [Candidatus Peregrinibacteria bacterium GW2011_GWA2_38_36]KKR07151.1 MAG: hypothetical protein UT33_C0005G0095 [Candidatus Peregrinibacteria bacterium GW2011_GWC2_39_14]
MPKTLDSLRIVPGDFAADYDQGDRNYSEFRRMHVMHERGATKADIIASPNFSGELGLLIARYRAWIVDKRVPYAIQGILELNKLGVFPATKNAQCEDPLDQIIHDEIVPFTADNSLFPLLSLVMSTSFWRGSFSGSGASKSVGVRAPSDSFLQQALNDVFGGSVHKGEFNIKRIISRFIAVLGQPNPKNGADSEIIIPEPVQLALNTLESGVTSVDAKKKARRIVRDFMLAFFYTNRCKFSKSFGYSANLNASQTRERANEKWSIFRRALLESRLNVRVKVKTTTSKPRATVDESPKSRIHYHILQFPDLIEDDLEALRLEFDGRVADLIKTIKSPK